MLSFYGLDNLLPNRWTEENKMVAKKDLTQNNPNDRVPDIIENSVSDPLGLRDNFYLYFLSIYI